MLTQQATGWNRRKRDNLHRVLAHRYVNISIYTDGVISCFTCSVEGLVLKACKRWIRRPYSSGCVMSGNGQSQLKHVQYFVTGKTCTVLCLFICTSVSDCNCIRTLEGRYILKSRLSLIVSLLPLFCLLKKCGVNNNPHKFLTLHY